MGLALLLAGAAAATAGEIADAAQRAETQLGAGSAAEALESFDVATDAFWRALPLSFRRTLIVDSAEGYGRYKLRPERPFHPGDTMLIYLEPVGYGWLAEGSAFRVRLVADLEIRTGSGLILATAHDFATVEQAARARSREFQATIGLTLPNLKPDDYELHLTFRDAATGKKAEVTLPFAVAAP